MNDWQRAGIYNAIAWMLPAATLFILIRRNHQGSPAGFKLWAARIVFAAAVVIFTIEAFEIWKLPRRLHAPDYAIVVLWFGQMIIWARLCRLAGRLARKEAGIAELPTGSRGTFFWQGLLILLPMAGLACFGLYSLREDRLLAEEEARESGEILAQRLAQAGSTDAIQSLRDYREAVFDLHANRTADLGQSSWEGGAESENAAWQRIRAWQQANPEIDLFSLPEVEYVQRFQPESLLPQPPPWLQQLNPGQQRLWQAAQEAEFVSNDFPAAQSVLREFIGSKPPDGARANAEYLRLLAKTHGLAGAEASAQFSGSQWNNSDELTEAGLPVGQLICYQALRLMPDSAGVPDKFLRTIGWAISYRPSVFSPRLIAEAERIAKRTSSETNAATLRGWWETDRTARQVQTDFEEQYPTNTWTNAAYWVNSSAGEYLAILDDGTETPAHKEAADYNRYIFPRVVLKKAFVTAVNKADISLPAYALIQLEMAGEKMSLSRGAAAAATNGQLPVLGEAAGKLEWLPRNTHTYPFKIRVLLADPDVLYARQSMRTRLFGTLILASAVAALAGFFAARQAFYRQLRLSEMKSNFVSSVSHELRAPIASVRLMAEGLERGKILGAEKQSEYFRFIVQECRRLSSLIENVLDFSRIERGRKQYELESTDLVALTEQTVKLMENYAAERDVKISMTVSGEAVPVEAEGKAIQQALVNLIDNAIKHSPKGAEIMVGLEFIKCGVRSAECGIRMEASSTKAAVQLWVEDKGEGIPAAEHEKIFERFYRIGSELRRETQGVGIGLSIVKHIVEGHGGKVIVQSQVGQGSRFTIELPVNGVKGRA